MSYIDEFAVQGTGEKAPGAETKQHAHIQPDRIWVVLARRAYDQPLAQVGTIEADDPEMASVYARSIYDEFAWVEMAVVPRDALVTVIAS
jgi:1,2-phenylacetyl-CoA epoxidase PaaB subunit